MPNFWLTRLFTITKSSVDCQGVGLTKKYFNYFAGSDQYRPPRPQNPRPQKRLAFPILRNVNNYFKSLSRTFKRKLRRQRRVRKRVRRDYQKAYRTHLVEVPSFERRYGFRCKITLVDKQQCQLGVSCDSEGNRLSERIIKRQAGEEFLATGPPECHRIVTIGMYTGRSKLIKTQDEFFKKNQLQIISLCLISNFKIALTM